MGEATSALKDTPTPRYISCVSNACQKCEPSGAIKSSKSALANGREGLASRVECSTHPLLSDLGSHWGI